MRSCKLVDALFEPFSPLRRLCFDGYKLSCMNKFVPTTFVFVGTDLSVLFLARQAYYLRPFVARASGFEVRYTVQKARFTNHDPLFLF